MITVILPPKLIHRLFIRQSVAPGKRLKFRSKNGFYFRTGHTTQSSIGRMQTDVLQLVQITENTHLSKLGHSRDKDQLQISIGILQYSIKRHQRLTKVTLQFRIIKRAKHRLVIFVYQHHYTPACLFIGTADDGHKTNRVTPVNLCHPVFRLPRFKLAFKQIGQALVTVIFLCIQAEVHHRIHKPVLLQPLNGKPLEQVFLSQKVSFQRREQQALAKPPRTAQETGDPRLRQPVNQFRFIYIEIPSGTKFLKTLYPNRKFTGHRITYIHIASVFISLLLHAKILIVFRYSSMSKNEILSYSCTHRVVCAS